MAKSPRAFQVLQVDPDEGLNPLDYERKALADAGAEFVEGRCLTAAEVIERGQDAQVLWLAWKPGIDREVLEGLPNVELVIRWGVGYDQIDVAAATELGVAVANAPDYGTVDVAEHVIALLMSGARRVAWYHEEMRRGVWPDAAIGKHFRMRGRQLGIIGVGRIGAAVAERAKGLGLRVVGYDPALTADQLVQRGVEPLGLDELLATSDYVSLHMPLNTDTHHFFNADLIAAVKPGAALINASRGKVVDTDALIAALTSGQLAWAGLDVYEDEPLPSDHPIRAVPEVILTPHVAGYSVEAWQDLREEMCLTTLQWQQTGWAERVVNPQVRSNLRADR
jgi:D-3-phosphoglycerate dehydrogenase